MQEIVTPIEFRELRLNLVIPLIDSNPLDYFIAISQDILNGELDFNYMKYRNVLFTLMTKSPKELHTTILILFFLINLKNQEKLLLYTFLSQIKYIR